MTTGAEKMTTQDRLAAALKIAREWMGNSNAYSRKVYDDHFSMVNSALRQYEAEQKQEATLPMFKDIYGMAPNATNGVPAEEFIANVRAKADVTPTARQEALDAHDVLIENATVLEFLIENLGEQLEGNDILAVLKEQFQKSKQAAYDLHKAALTTDQSNFSEDVREAIEYFQSKFDHSEKKGLTLTGFPMNERGLEYLKTLIRAATTGKDSK